MIETKHIDRITEAIGQNFRTFGGDQPTNNNPVAIALEGKPYQFAMGVDVRNVVEAVLAETGHDALLEALNHAHLTLLRGCSTENCSSKPCAECIVGETIDNIEVAISAAEGAK